MAAHGDLVGMLTGPAGTAPAWRMAMTAAPADLSGETDALARAPGAGSAGGVPLLEGMRISMTEDKNPPDPRPDEERVNRDAKRGRLVVVETMQPPKAFTAGSVLKRVSALFDRPETPKELMAFAKAETAGTEMIVAQTFYRKQDEKAPDPEVPVLIADLVTNRDADVLATAYAPADPLAGRESPFDAILKKDPDEGRFRPEIGPKDHAWAANILPPSVFSKKEQKCLADAIYFESRGEPLKGQAAVAQVVLNRVRNPAFPDTICDVVYQNKDWTNQCQFSFACDRIKDVIWSPERHAVAEEIALAVTAGKIWLPEVGSSTHYHAVYVKPNWAPTMKRVAKIGWHIFYRTYGGGWS